MHKGMIRRVHYTALSQTCFGNRSATKKEITNIVKIELAPIYFAVCFSRSLVVSLRPPLLEFFLFGFSDFDMCMNL